MLFYCTKEFTSLPSAIIAEVAMTVWLCFLFQGSVSTILAEKLTIEDIRAGSLIVLELGINIGIVTGIMDKLKDSYVDRLKLLDEQE